MWKGLIPGKSLYEDAVAELGEPGGTSKLVNGVVQEFSAGRVRISFLEHRTVISKIRVLPHDGDDLPPRLEDAVRTYGAMQPARFDKLQGIICERPGVRLACDNNAPYTVRWVEFFEAAPEEAKSHQTVDSKSVQGDARSAGSLLHSPLSVRRR